MTSEQFFEVNGRIELVINVKKELGPCYVVPSASCWKLPGVYESYLKESCLINGQAVEPSAQRLSSLAHKEVWAVEPTVVTWKKYERVC